MTRVVFVVVAVLCALAAGFFIGRFSKPTPSTPQKPVAPAATVAPKPVERPREVESPAATTERPEVAPRRSPAAKRVAPATPAPAPAAAPDTATLTIQSDVPGAQVFIDREFVGTAPVTAPNIKPGSHRINVSAEGYDGYAETIDVAAGPREIVANLKTVRLDAAIDVVHKHRMGSCKGRLVATPEGIRYETSDKDDVFSAPLADLQTFQVDYLQKNLRVQIRKGKRYDFTDPDGNADRLFVFHRDVEKARQRLK